ncbi:hypothetical protein TTHERM_01473460 (macronuclear) [Tetrahymena thermophila SB210]|uniref:Uncharacterized protein n=1 Tax=Tetrahymena thermophila (strain SB210) TaxID=312017 RepID=Q228X6_TETTS|nr:hypothetical protein TTHERM_01473460 [Tetrahymena thermophila SB210]EAR81842.2 hypothetical protein TTHERM_01473460 [Tetrahymena thermophila SB210]|eukprot:XP_001029505.2 hypothetical protein TTHERM_01473460 [Tetrahymena thermophila SB210]
MISLYGIASSVLQPYHLSGVIIGLLMQNHKRLFKDQQINQTIKQNKLNDLATENQQKLNSESDYSDKDNMNSPNTVYTSKINQSPIFLQFEDLNLVSNQKESQKDKEDNSNKLIKLNKNTQLLKINKNQTLNAITLIKIMKITQILQIVERQTNLLFYQCNIYNRFEELNIAIDQKESQNDKEDNSNEQIKLNSVKQVDKNNNLIYFTKYEIDNTLNI